MTAVSTPVRQAAARPFIPRSALAAFAMIAIAVAIAFVVVTGVVGASHASAGYDAPFYSQYLQEMSQGW